MVTRDDHQSIRLIPRETDRLDGCIDFGLCLVCANKRQLVHESGRRHVIGSPLEGDDIAGLALSERNGMMPCDSSNATLGVGNESRTRVGKLFNIATHRHAELFAIECAHHRRSVSPICSNQHHTVVNCNELSVWWRLHCHGAVKGRQAGRLELLGLWAQLYVGVVRAITPLPVARNAALASVEHDDVKPCAAHLAALS